MLFRPRQALGRKQEGDETAKLVEIGQESEVTAEKSSAMKERKLLQ